ncbi:hypothetical protein V6N13_048507 [Hibiscus sabdariffa]|uniref:Uncharacterized protein n=1 Tax=Hibiscus sabdariffa TaxID=183260 RepID=A0ABR2F7E0_9ROSI
MDLFSPGSNPGGDLSWQSHPTDGSYSIYRWNNQSGAPPGDSHVRRYSRPDSRATPDVGSHEKDGTIRPLSSAFCRETPRGLDFFAMSFPVVHIRTIVVSFLFVVLRSCTTTLTAQAWAGPTSIPRGAIRGGSSTYGFHAEPFQQWGLGTDMMIGLGRVADLLREPVGINA